MSALALVPCLAGHAGTGRDHLRRFGVGTCPQSRSEVRTTSADIGHHMGTWNTDRARAGKKLPELVWA